MSGILLRNEEVPPALLALATVRARFRAVPVLQKLQYASQKSERWEIVIERCDDLAALLEALPKPASTRRPDGWTAGRDLVTTKRYVLRTAKLGEAAVLLLRMETSSREEDRK